CPCAALGARPRPRAQQSGPAGWGLRALQAEIEPHFLFNCLNTIASFIRTDPDRARSLVLAFADYCRWTLGRPGEFVTLAEELRHVESYLALEQARFGSQLRVEIDASREA